MFPWTEPKLELVSLEENLIIFAVYIFLIVTLFTLICYGLNKLFGKED